MGKYIMALDAGTTSSRCILFNHQGEIVSMAQKELRQSFPKPGWVEHDPGEIWSSQLGVAIEAMAKIDAHGDDISGIGITNQRETSIIWDKKTGDPVYPAICWQCRRTAPMTDDLRRKGYGEKIRKKTGLIVDPYFSATKIRWILDHIDKGQERAEKGELLFGTVDTWLIYKLTGSHLTDYSNASRTMLFNINTLDWDDEILELLAIPKKILPEVRPSSGIFAHTKKQYFGNEIPIAGAAGDQQSALFGQSCFQKGQAKNTYGTGAFLLMNTGSSPRFSSHGLITTIAWGIEDQLYYALEGSIFVAGSAVQWLRDELRIVDRAEDTEYMATRVPDTGGCFVVPAFTGLGAPYWDPYARGAIVGITRGTTKYHIIRATLESLAYLSRDVLQAMSDDLGEPLQILKVDGGAANNNFLMQYQADMIDRKVERPKCLETTALGAAFLAGLATGFWKDQEEIEKIWESDRIFTPNMEEALRQEKLHAWERAVKSSMGWAKE